MESNLKKLQTYTPTGLGIGTHENESDKDLSQDSVLFYEVD